ncbi:MAG TPA: tetratricopeptide repeat protein [Opitutaceae bacterium]|jgi:tetratricopeptide (TPR) repeat protein|nr:tetratricopeptide repeat protein [Opitutaceae bacterium]
MLRKSRARAAAFLQQVAASAKASAARGVLPPPEPKAFLARRGSLLASGIIVLAALAAYHNSFSGPFIFNDQFAITNNPSIRHFWSALSPPPDSTVNGRPLLNFTFALNYALGGLNAWGYHAFNLLVHALAGLTLFGLVRRTLASRLATRGSQISDFKSKIAESPATAQSEILNLRFEMPEATLLALAVAVIWVVHPLQTEAVTYISQRAESLVGLFYLLTLYCFVRSADSPATVCWQTFSILACILGVMSKEIIVTAPVMVFLYDRTFVAGSFREAWSRRWRYYLGLASMWLLLLARLRLGLREQGIGFDRGVTWWSYALTSCRSVVLYLKLALWPHPLVFDYGTDVVRNAATVLPELLALIVLVAGVAIALRQCPIIGFVGAWFFVILAPTSSVVPVTLQPMAEHRMYLSLAAMIGLVVTGLYALFGRRSLILCAAAAVGLGWLDLRRNEDYRSALAMGNDTIAKCPDNARAHYNLGVILTGLGRSQEAITEYKAALRINPHYAEAHVNLGNTLLQAPGHLPEAITEYEAALRINPNYAEAHANLGNALSNIPSRLPDEIAEYEAALRINPDDTAVHFNLAVALATIPGRLPEAISHYEAALRINPHYAEAHNNLGIALAQTPGRWPEAIAHFEAALRINPNYAEAHNNLGIVLAQTPGRWPEARAHFEAALRLNPDFTDARRNLMIINQGPAPQP